MNTFLLSRAQGFVSPQTFSVTQTCRLLHSLEPAPGIRFNSQNDVIKKQQSAGLDIFDDGPLLQEVSAHRAGVNTLAIDQHEGRYLFSGGADPSIHFWDLESRGSELEHIHRPLASVHKSSHKLAHTHAITSLSIYPFDPTPSTILTTSHDRTLKLFAITPHSIAPAHTFDLQATPYSHSISSHLSSTLLIAVATSEKPVRLLDLRTGLSTHALPGHNSSVVSVAWAPHHPHLLASGSIDNRGIVFDIRRAGHNSAIATLDMGDAVGVVLDPLAPHSFSNRPSFSQHARAHNGTVTGVRWTSNGSHLVTAGQDARIRVWDATTGANTLVHFGPRIRNSVSSHIAERAPLILPSHAVFPGHETLLWPNFNDQDDRGEIFMFELREGMFVKRLRVPGISSAFRHETKGQPNALGAGRINTLVWRGNGGSGEGLEMFSAHGDGTIRTWVSRVPENDLNEDDEQVADRKRKRDVLDEIYHGLSNRTVTFT